MNDNCCFEHKIVEKDGGLVEFYHDNILMFTTHDGVCKLCNHDFKSTLICIMGISKLEQIKKDSCFLGNRMSNHIVKRYSDKKMNTFKIKHCIKLRRIENCEGIEIIIFGKKYKITCKHCSTPNNRTGIIDEILGEKLLGESL